MITAALRYGIVMPKRSKRKPPQAGPMTRPRLASDEARPRMPPWSLGSDDFDTINVDFARFDPEICGIAITRNGYVAAVG